jgi:maltose/moltooligosaccharide transporter
MNTSQSPPPRSLTAALFVVQFLTWVGMFMLWVFSLPMIAALEPPEATSLAAATRTLGLLFALYVGLGAVFGLALPTVHARLGKARSHALALLFGAVGLLSVHWVTAPVMLFGSYTLVAVGWASIATTPYALASDAVRDGRYARAMGIFNFSTVIPQVVVALLMAPLTENLEPRTAIALGGCTMLFAAIIMALVSIGHADTAHDEES